MANFLYTLLFFIPPLLGIMIAFFLGRSGRQAALEEFSGDLEIEKKYQRTIGKFITMLIMPVTAIIFPFAIWFLGIASSDEIAEEVWVAMGINMGLAGFFTAAGCAAIINMGAKDVIKNDKKFGMYITLLVIPEMALIFSYALAFLTLGKDAGIAGELARANYICGACAIGALISGIIMRATGPIADDFKNFGRILTFGSMGIFISVMGFAYAFMVLLGAD